MIINNNVTIINHPENGLPCEFIITHMEKIICNELLTSNNNLIFITESPYIVRTIEMISSYLHLAQERKYFNVVSDNVIFETSCADTYKRMYQIFQELDNYLDEDSEHYNLNEVLDTMIRRGYTVDV